MEISDVSHYLFIKVKIEYNGLQICEGKGLEVQIFNLKQN